MLRLYRIPWSTNVARVEIALGLKGVEWEPVDCDPADRSPIRAVSAQDLVPVVQLGDEVLADSPAILRWIERRWPQPPLWPAGAAQRAEMDTFIDWFNLAWKVAPNAIDAELARSDPDRELVARLGAELSESLERFEALLDGRDFLLGDSLSAADVFAWPFLKYARGCPPGDDESFHRVLAEHLASPPARVLAWIERVDSCVPATSVSG